MDKILTIGTTIKILSNAIKITAYNEAEGKNYKNFYDSNKHMIDRMKDFDVSNMKEKDIEKYLEYIKKVDDWAGWAKEKGYLKGFQQTAITDFYLLLFKAASYQMPLDRNMTEHLLCFAIAKVLYNQIKEYMNAHPDEDKYYAMYYCLATFDYFGDDERYIQDCKPIESTFILLSRWVKDMNQLISFWKDAITEHGLRNDPPNLNSYIAKWKSGQKISWEFVKLFFNDKMKPSEDYFIDEEHLKKDGYRTFTTSLFFAYILTNLFDYLEKEEILSKESIDMIRNGIRLYYRDFYVIRKHGNPEYSDDFEEEAKNNLMFRIMFLMLDGNLDTVSFADYLSCSYLHPDFSILQK